MGLAILFDQPPAIDKTQKFHVAQIRRLSLPEPLRRQPSGHGRQVAIAGLASAVSRRMNASKEIWSLLFGDCPHEEDYGGAIVRCGGTLQKS